MQFPLTQENITNFFATHGWGCKLCGRLVSNYGPNSWFQSSDDIYCQPCAVLLCIDPGVLPVRLPTCAELGIEPTRFERDGSEAGFEYAAHQRREFESLDIECPAPAVAARYLAKIAIPV